MTIDHGSTEHPYVASAWTEDKTKAFLHSTKCADVKIGARIMLGRDMKRIWGVRECMRRSPYVVTQNTLEVSLVNRRHPDDEWKKDANPLRRAGRRIVWRPNRLIGDEAEVNEAFWDIEHGDLIATAQASSKGEFLRHVVRPVTTIRRGLNGSALVDLGPAVEVEAQKLEDCSGFKALKAETINQLKASLARVREERDRWIKVGEDFRMERDAARVQRDEALKRLNENKGE